MFEDKIMIFVRKRIDIQNIQCVVTHFQEQIIRLFISGKWTLAPSEISSGAQVKVA